MPTYAHIHSHVHAHSRSTPIPTPMPTLTPMPMSTQGPTSPHLHTEDPPPPSYMNYNYSHHHTYNLNHTCTHMYIVQALPDCLELFSCKPHLETDDNTLEALVAADPGFGADVVCNASHIRAVQSSVDLLEWRGDTMVHYDAASCMIRGGLM